MLPFRFIASTSGAVLVCAACAEGGGTPATPTNATEPAADPAATPAVDTATPAPNAAPDPGGQSVKSVCDPLMEAHCNRCLPKEMQRCVKDSIVWCYHGRDGARGSGMNAEDVQLCKKAYLSLNCDAAENGYVPQACPGLHSSQ